MQSIQELFLMLDGLTRKVSKTANKNAAVSEALKTIRKYYKLDLKETAEINSNIEFIYKIEGIKEAVYIIATANKTPRTWKQLSYLII